MIKEIPVKYAFPLFTKHNSTAVKGCPADSATRHPKLAYGGDVICVFCYGAESHL